MYHSIIFVISFLFVYLLTFLVRKVATVLNFVDKPEERKYHTKPTALMGGITILVGLIFGYFITFLICSRLIPDNHKIFYFLICSVLISLLGLYDDRKGMRPQM